MVAPLLDLQNRINSNTLTPLQQGALASALAVIIPLFPQIDEQGNSVPASANIPVSEEWIAALYSINSLSPAGGSVSPTTQIAWFINPITGNDANDGATLGTPLRTIAALGSLWRGSAGGGRPVLKPASGSTIAVNLVGGSFPVTDPLSVILDVDIANGASLVIIGAAAAPAKTGVIATANAWARTSANGQIRITDGTVPDYGAFVGSVPMFVDTTNGGVGWLYGPDTGASATGTLSVAYGPQAPGVIGVPARTPVTAAHNYTLSALLGASLGSGFVTRSFPSEAGPFGASVYIYRLDLSQADNTSTVNLVSDTLLATVFQECVLRHQLINDSGNVILANTFSTHNLGLLCRGGTSTMECLWGGGVSGQNGGTVSAQSGGTILVDADHFVFSSTPHLASFGGLLEIGNASHWQNAGTGALQVQEGIATLVLGVGATSIFYGTDGGGPALQVGSAFGKGTMLYRNDASGTPATTQFQFNHPTFSLGESPSPFGVTLATAAYVGPTTATFAHLDAALAAGTGFGGLAVDNATGSVMRATS